MPASYLTDSQSWASKKHPDFQVRNSQAHFDCFGEKYEKILEITNCHWTGPIYWH